MIANCRAPIPITENQLLEIFVNKESTSPNAGDSQPVELVPSTSSPDLKTSRRNFLAKTGATVAVAATVSTPKLALARSANVAGNGTIKLGLIGAGSRGTAAANQAMDTNSGNVELTAIGDIFEDRMAMALEESKAAHEGKVNIPASQRFIGMDAYKRVLDSDVDIVVLATPPGFRPLHFENAIDADKHVFMEKPVAVDLPGIKRVLAAGKIAEEKGLYVGVGLQRRHQRIYKEMMDRVHNGMIGTPVYARVYWNSGGVWNLARSEGDTELQYQLRNWYYFNWLCGDHIVEQHIHNLDVINWLRDSYPVEAAGMGGRLMRTGPTNGEIFDHHAVEYQYDDGFRMISQCRHMRGCYNTVEEQIVGTDGYTQSNSKQVRMFNNDGEELYASREEKGEPSGWEQEHHDLFANMANGTYVNEAEYGAKSTMTAILGRLATYSGKRVELEKAMEHGLTLANVDEISSFDQPAPVQPNDDGSYDIPTPGRKVIDVLGYK